MSDTAATAVFLGTGATGRGRSASIQYLRAIAASLVLLTHSLHAAGRTGWFIGWGVDLFFVISGFLMVAITDATSRPVGFLRDRFLRLVPLYWIATVAWLSWVVTAGRSLPSLERIVASFLFVPLNSLQAGVHSFPALAVGWTLNYEVLFYVLFAATLSLRPSRRIAALTTIFIGLVAVGFVFQPRNGTLNYWTNPIILEFLAGAWLATVLRLPDQPRRRQGWLLIAAMPPMLVAFQASLWKFGFLPVNAYRGWLCIPMAMLLAGALLLDDRRGGPRLPWLASLGDASYSLYLFHPIALGVTGWALHKVALPVWIGFAITLAAGLFAGILAHFFIERPLLRWLRRPRARRGWPVMAGPSPAGSDQARLGFAQAKRD